MNSLVNIYLENRKKDKKAGRITATWVIETTELLLNIHGKEELKAAAAAKPALLANILFELVQPYWQLHHREKAFSLYKQAQAVAKVLGRRSDELNTLSISEEFELFVGAGELSGQIHELNVAHDWEAIVKLETKAMRTALVARQVRCMLCPRQTKNENLNL